MPVLRFAIPFLVASLVSLILAALSLAAEKGETVLWAKFNENSLAVVQYKNGKGCDIFSAGCIVVRVNGKPVVEGIGTNVEFNALYPSREKPRIVVVTTETGGNQMVSETRIVDLEKSGKIERQFLFNFAGQIKVKPVSDTKFELTGLFYNDDLGDKVESTLVYDRATGEVYTKPKDGRFDYSRFIGRHPDDLLSDKDARKEILDLLGSRYFKMLRDFAAVADTFVGSEVEATKWISVKACKAHDCTSSQSFILIDIEEATAVVVIKEDNRGLPVFSLWSTAPLSDSQLTMASFHINGWLQQFGAAIEPARGFHILNYANPENDGVSHLAPAPPSEARGQMSTGTGFAISQLGHVLTNNHVVESCKSISLTRPGSDTVEAFIIATDPQNDLAVVKFAPKAGIATASFRSGSIKVGTDVVVFGYPLSDILAASGNIVTGNITALAGMGNDSRMQQISAPIQPGNSGGPVLDHSGRVVAVVVARLKAEVGNPQNVNFAIKSSIATTFLEGAGVPFVYGEGAGDLATPEVAELAQGFTYLISCQN